MPRISWSFIETLTESSQLSERYPKEFPTMRSDLPDSLMRIGILEFLKLKLRERQRPPKKKEGKSKELIIKGARRKINAKQSLNGPPGWL